MSVVKKEEKGSQKQIKEIQPSSVVEINTEGGFALASPKTRKFARELGVNINFINALSNLIINKFNFDRFKNLENKFPSIKFTPPPQCMPDEYKHEDYITAYRQYYIGEKKRFAKYTYVDIPHFMC